MRTIYYKKAPENPESLKVILKDYFEKNSPATYWSDNNGFQCDKYRNRSIDDLILLANHYFPGSTCKDVLNVYVELTKEIQLNNPNKYYVFFVCGNVNRPVLLKQVYEVEGDWTYNLILHKSYMEAESPNSEYTMKSLKGLLDND